MAGKADLYEQDILKLLLNGTPIANVADNAATGPLTNLYVALHSADPLSGTTEGGTQTTSEVAYTSYARVAVARNNGSPAWTVTTDGNGVTRAVPTAAINFPKATGGTAAATHFSIGSAASGAGRVFYAGPLTLTLNVSNGVTPQLDTTTYIQED
ncbi:MAG: Sphingobium phage Lacusarx [Pseudomonadota bacterium]|jgi:hypothetical protein